MRTFALRPSSPLRLDMAIASSEHSFSRRAARKLLGEHRVLVNGAPVAAASRVVRPEDVIVVVPEAIELSVLRETADWIALDKPSGLASQPGRDRSRPSAVELLALLLKQRGQVHGLFVVHRLDAGTSGVIVYARTPEAAARLSKAFASREMKKRYAVIVRGELPERLDLEKPIARTGTSSFNASAGGKEARTTVRRAGAKDGVSFGSVEIESGRTHQIRVHLADAGFPVLGDLKYGVSGAGRLMLHSLSLSHPSIGRVEAPLPADMREVLDRLGLPTKIR
ncbi:MAG: RluA family pseudouridine synthase [Acidobacteriota bacterium]